jgi:hypothetical protein
MVLPLTSSHPPPFATLLHARQGSVKPYTRIEGPDAWYATQYEPDQGGQAQPWLHRLTPEEVGELDAAVEGLLSSGLVVQEGDRVTLVGEGSQWARAALCTFCRMPNTPNGCSWAHNPLCCSCHCTQMHTGVAVGVIAGQPSQAQCTH